MQLEVLYWGHWYSFGAGPHGNRTARSGSGQALLWGGLQKSADHWLVADFGRSASEPLRVLLVFDPLVTIQDPGFFHLSLTQGEAGGGMRPADPDGFALLVAHAGGGILADFANPNRVEPGKLLRDALGGPVFEAVAPFELAGFHLRTPCGGAGCLVLHECTARSGSGQAFCGAAYKKVQTMGCSPCFSGLCYRAARLTVAAHGLAGYDGGAAHHGVPSAAGTLPASLASLRPELAREPKGRSNRGKGTKMVKSDEAGAVPVGRVTLRPYQALAVESARAQVMAKTKDNAPPRSLIVLPTGCGKTRTAIAFLQAAISKNPSARILWLAHREELLTQPIRAMLRMPETENIGKLCGIVQGNRRQVKRQIVMASIQTLGHRNGIALKAYLENGPPSMVFVDEAHHSTSPQWDRVFEAIDGAHLQAHGKPAVWIGLTATPERTDGDSLARRWGSEPALSYQITEAIRDGYLCPPVFFDCQLQLSEEAKRELKIAQDQGDDDAIERILIAGNVVPHTVASMERHLTRQDETKIPTIVFCAARRQCELTTEALLQAGWRAALLMGDTPSGQRAAMLEGFERGRLDVLVNCGVLTEGTDLPICGGIVAARPFASKPLWIQSVGRGLRLFEGKNECIVVDLGGAHKEHHGIVGVSVLGEVEELDAAGKPAWKGATFFAKEDLTLRHTERPIKVPKGEPVADSRLQEKPLDREPVEDGTVYVRACMVKNGRILATVTDADDWRGAQLYPIALGTKRMPAQGSQGKRKQNAPLKPFIAWRPIPNALEPGMMVPPSIAELLLPIEGRELVRVEKGGLVMNLTRDREAVRPAWVTVTWNGQKIRIVNLDRLDAKVSPGMLICAPVPDIMFDGHPTFTLWLRHMVRITPELWQEDEMIQPIAKISVFSEIEAIAGDYIRQTGRQNAQDAPWRLGNVQDSTMAYLRRFKLDHAWITNEGEARDVLVERVARMEFEKFGWIEKIEATAKKNAAQWDAIVSGKGGQDASQ